MKKIAVLLVIMAVLFSAVGAYAAPAAAVKSDHTFTATASTNNLPYQCIAGTPCKLAMEFKNESNKTVSLVNWTVAADIAAKLQIDAKLEPGAPTQVEAGKTAIAVMMVIFPDAAGGKTVPLQCKVQYGTIITQTKLDVSVTPRFEAMMLPTRLILGPDSEPKTLGMSVINHMDKPYEGKIKFKVTNGLVVNPAEIEGKIDALGLEAYMVKVEHKENAAPGHYTIWVAADDMYLEWAMVDVPAKAKKSDLKNIVNSGAQKVAIANAAGKSIGAAMFAFDSSNLYVLISTTAEPENIQIGIDPLIDGAKTYQGGLKADDLMLKIGKARSLECSKKNAKVGLAGFGSGFDRNSGNYIVSVPWKALAPFKLAKNKMIAASILINKQGSKYEFGGGIAGKVDPRLFVPVVLSD
ncbi:MAG: hypothetical protein NT018_09840 [Armatimonadetes bacterium]|nr:hypothetical protein [Armatimonadota bacterium]